MGKMILGTVQLGMPYGVNNTSGKPEIQDAMNILDYAYQNNIDMLDTASEYGNSEEIIGQYQKHSGVQKRFEICTKLPADVDAAYIPDYYEKSRMKLQTDRFYIYYIHRFDQCKNQEILKQLCRLKERDKIANLGVSVYQPDELEYILANLMEIVDVVQIPFSVFDNARWGRLLTRAGERGLQLYARSVFLQGLILSDPDSELCRKKGVSKQILQLQDIAKNLGMQVAQLALDYVNSVNEISRWLIGCETVEQLKDNIVKEKNVQRLSRSVCSEIEKISSSLEDNVIDPRKWNA